MPVAAAGVRADDDGVTVTLLDGDPVDADLLVVACGVRPDTALATAAGLDVDRGVVVTDQLATSDPAIYAIGDCAQHRGVCGGLVAPAWAQAAVVADVLTGTARSPATGRPRRSPGSRRPASTWPLWAT